jgi:hypothetical protein
MVASRMCRGWSKKDMFGAEIGPCPMATDELKRLRCETLVSRKHRLLRRFEFGGIF